MKLLLDSPITLSCNFPQMWTERWSVTVYSRGTHTAEKTKYKKITLCSE